MPAVEVAARWRNEPAHGKREPRVAQESFTVVFPLPRNAPIHTWGNQPQ